MSPEVMAGLAAERARVMGRLELIVEKIVAQDAAAQKLWDEGAPYGAYSRAYAATANLVQRYIVASPSDNPKLRLWVNYYNDIGKQLREWAASQPKKQGKHQLLAFGSDSDQE